jgi:hypothetical protein
MLVVTVSVWPGGDHEKASEIARIGLANTSNLSDFSNYDLVALLDRDRAERVIRSEVNQHERAQGWVPLARRALTEIHLSEPGIHGVAYDDPTAVLLRKGSHDAGFVRR